MKKLFVMVGIPGSGKTTWIKNNIKTGEDIHVSRDKIRFSLLKDEEEYFEHEKEVYQRYIEAISIALTTSFNVRVFADATHLTEKNRAKLLKSLALDPAYVEINAVYFSTDLSTCLKRNAEREKRQYVPEEVIKNMYNVITFPKYEEGFKKIYRVNDKNKGMDIFKYTLLETINYNSIDEENFKYVCGGRRKEINL